ncbi:A disintegrin and metalloproteinase with thrombospondin motifs 9 [Phymastichus coffea]|uniref:A disintegrin and metalloproteinase with thrombospondin motifs 9 n=1 Tax=Phymastichus coffea TaxID=108790 RepID=UPI00273CD027|nr:A disintegrin and metalloproteinase with thrombospondin motifs 9 [Phymastichus coffea]XP_058791064.1 A disintegrin and metalloproteinase with thrombospondin motifs 9 [Phymastichus coffea]
MGSCRSQRFAEVVVGLALALLVALVVVLWTGSAGGARELDANATAAPATTVAMRRQQQQQQQKQMPVYTRDLLQHVETEAPGTTSEEPKWRDDEPTWSHWKADILPSGGGGDSEHIVLAKANQNSYEDPLDEHSKAERHHSGHFRHVQSKVWDPHPQYEFIAFGRKFHLSLKEDSSFAPSGVSVTHISDNITRREYPDYHLGCFYSGFVEGDPKSNVAVSLCHGMTGHLRTSSGNYLIKPTEQGPVGSPLRHVIYRQPKVNLGAAAAASAGNRTANDLPDIAEPTVANATATRECGLMIDTDTKETGDAGDTAIDDELRGRRRRRHVTYPYERDDNSYAELDWADRGSDLDIYGSWRTRRAMPREYFIEIMVVADSKMIDYHGPSLTSYILVLMSTVSRIYKDPSIGNPVSIAVINIKQVDEVFGTKQRDSDGIGAAEMLRKFCHWQKLNNPSELSPEHHDAALLLTRENLCHNPDQRRCDTLGLAELGRMCSPGSSCAIVQDNGLATAFTIAHEIGHVLNMPHDDDPKCTRFRDQSGVHNIMSRMLDDNTVPWEWSKCSRHYVTEFLDAGSGNCLLDKPGEGKVMSRSLNSRLPGEDYSENKQCELVYGQRSEICPHMVSDVCKRLWCTVPYWDDRSEECHTQHMPWADGTVCGPGKWCHRGECVSRENLEPLDGQWGDWSSYGECSRSCGGGIERKYRECNNPAPKHGGNYCVGERVRYRSCNTRECPPGSTDFREKQCAAFDNDNRNIRNLAKNVKWHAKYTRILPEDRCKLYCQVAGNQYYMLRDKVIDGTPCGPDTFHVCVNGHCKPAGCDHMLNSTAALDTCGVCRGDNSSCQRITGSYNSSEYGYTRITKIPAGSSYIDIRQHGWKASHNDSNYLALRLNEGGKYILNGNFMVMHRKVIVQPGVTIEYSGPEQVVERLNSSRPIQVDLILEILSVGNVYPPQITYEYTVPKRILATFTWILNDWTPCDRMCKGISYRQALCRNAETKELMSESYCPIEDKPPEMNRPCNTHCELKWQEIANTKSECSSHCGPGTTVVKHHCVQINLDRPDLRTRNVPPYVCYHLDRPHEVRPCKGPCDYAHWLYSEWSTCSVTCGDNGVQSRTALCVDRDNKTVQEGNCSKEARVIRQLCGVHQACPKWTFGEWSPCSVTCGFGKRQRPYWCRIDNRVVHPSNCKGHPTGITEVCDAGSCPIWQTGDWNECSTTCGEGIRRRTVTCKFTNGTATTFSHCDPLTRPFNSISCPQSPCPTKATFTPVTYSSHLPSDELSQHENEVDGHRISFRSGYEWHIEGFETCTKSCGGGIARQIVQCISIETSKVVPNIGYCDANNRPNDTVACNEHQCPNWTTGGWNQCDVKCGEGYQHRQVLCQDLRGEIVNDSDCSEKSRPKHARRCQKAECRPNRNNFGSQAVATYKWRTGPWSECSVSCGNGMRRREVSCHLVNSWGWQDPSPVSSIKCSLSDKPVSQQWCKQRNCNDQYVWQPGPWRKCSQQCGRKGRQSRRLFCYDVRHNKKVKRRGHCLPQLRPQRKRKCNQKLCVGPTTCLEVQTRLKTNVDGEYTILVGGRYMSIYCHAMDANEPTEYLTLPTGERENYAEIYDKRLRDPTICPYNGIRNDSCECADGTDAIAGRTMFKRIRIDVHILHVIADDYRFAMKAGPNHIPYGKSGDCYSQRDCPQGRFSINLSGTLLMLAPEVHWPKQPNTYTMINKVNNQQVYGKCGGYCGFCAPSPGLKLNVLPP